MPQRLFICPKCGFESSPENFTLEKKNWLRCRRCRSSFEDPSGYREGITYADTDSERVVSHFPFFLDARNTVIHVPDGYLAYVTGAGMAGSLLKSGEYTYRGGSGALQVYYICLNPKVIWGSSGLRSYGVYGVAQLAISEGYVESCVERDPNFVNNLERELRSILCRHMSGFVTMTLGQNSSAVLHQPAGYIGAHGVMREGIRIVGVEPLGSTENGNLSTATTFSKASTEKVAAAAVPVKPKADTAVLTEPVPNSAYTVPEGVEDVFYYSMRSPKRHKSGEQITQDMLKGLKQYVRVVKKKFEYPWGWGLSDQICIGVGTYSANGTISLCIDGTVKLGELVLKAGSFERFADQFFSDVLQKELSEKLQKLVEEVAGRRGFDPSKINNHLSSMSVNLTDALNGEGSQGGRNVLQRFGLRVDRADIMYIDFRRYGEV